MNDMEALYEEFRKLREEVEGLNLDELGAFRLREYRRRFESLQRRDHELQSATRVNPEIDNEECRQILNLGDRMWSELGNTMIPIVELIDVKMALGKEVASERIHIKELKEENLKTIKTLENQNKRFKKSVEGITDPELRSVFEERIHSDEEIIQRLKDLDARYTERINELAARLRIIALGGKLPELEDIRRDTEGLEPGEAEEEARRLAETPEEELPGVTPDEEEEPAMDGGLPGVTFEGDGVDPIVPTDGEPSDVPAPTDAPTDGPEIVPTPTIRPEEPAEEPVPALVDPVTPTEGEEPVPALVGDDTPAETPAEEPAEEPVPALVDGETPAETPVEETPVRGESRNPKTKLWAKIDKVLKAAKVFLLTAIAVHTGLIINGATKNNVEPNTNTDTVEETETPEETQTPEETSQVTPETTPETTPEVTPTAPAEPVAPVAPVAPVTPEPTPVTPEPTPTVTVGENDVVLAPGESVYDATTGVEVGYTGTASRETENGTTPQQNRELEHVTASTVVVRQEQTQPDPVVTPLPRTGEEVTEEKARETMTQEEQTNLDQAIDEIDWDAFFNEGPTR